ncbi:MAG: fumarylacetoacetate hydrolase family protein [Desulfitobacteriaceae bacterium]
MIGFFGKSLDGTCPMGPFIVTRDSIEITNSTLEARVNGKRRQYAKITQMLFDIPKEYGMQ